MEERENGEGAMAVLGAQKASAPMRAGCHARVGGLGGGGRVKGQW